MAIGTLSHMEARHYADQGYLRLPNVYDPSETAELRNFVLGEASREQSAARDVGNVAMKMYGLYARNPELIHRAIAHPRLIGALQSLLGPNIVYVTNRHNHATVNSHTGEPAEGLHRDILQPSRGLVTASVLLEDSTAANGATRIIPGSHNLPSMGVPQADGGGTWMADHPEYNGMEEQAFQAEMMAGGVLLFNGLAFHGVGNNSSGETRVSLTLGFHSVDELATVQDPSQILVAGEAIYRGQPLPSAG